MVKYFSQKIFPDFTEDKTGSKKISPMLLSRIPLSFRHPAVL